MEAGLAGNAGTKGLIMDEQEVRRVYEEDAGVQAWRKSLPSFADFDPRGHWVDGMSGWGAEHLIPEGKFVQLSCCSTTGEVGSVFFIDNDPNSGIEAGLHPQGMMQVSQDRPREPWPGTIDPPLTDDVMRAKGHLL